MQKFNFDVVLHIYVVQLRFCRMFNIHDSEVSTVIILDGINAYIDFSSQSS